MWKTLDEKTLKSKKVVELREIAKTFGLQGYEKMKKADLIANLMREDPKEENSNKDDHDKSVHSRDPQPGSNHEPREPRENRDNHEPRETRESREPRETLPGNGTDRAAGRRATGRSYGYEAEPQEWRSDLFHL